MTTRHSQNRFYQAFCDVGAGHAVPPGALGAIQSELSQLRWAGGTPDRVDIAERISVKLLRLECALRLRDKLAVERYREDQRQLWWEWLDQPIDATPNQPVAEGATGPT